MFDHPLVQDGAVHYPGAVWLFPLLFGLAAFLNWKSNGAKPKVALVLQFVVLLSAIMGSLMLYVSPLSTACAGAVANMLTGLGDMFNIPMPVASVMAIAGIAALAATIIDLFNDPDYNPGAIACLVLAPILAHGAGGFLGVFTAGLYNSLAFTVLGVVIESTGA